MTPTIETDNLTRRFGRHLAVDAVSMTVPERSVYGFLGRNGAGKTTTLKMLLGLIRPTAGAARICGVDVVRDRRAAARSIGCLLEAHGFYANLTGRENLELTRTLLDVPATDVDRVLDVVEMRENGRRRVSDYSLGMRQRLGLARAMLGAPPVLVLDEPTNGLDPDGIADMRRFLKQLPDRTGATVLLSSHLLGELEQTATHIGILSEGRLVLEGELDRLKADVAPEIEIGTDDAPRAAALVAARGVEATAGAGGVIARLKVGEDVRAVSGLLNRMLNEAGVAVFAIGARPRTLEGIYHEVAGPAVLNRQLETV